MAKWSFRLWGERPSEGEVELRDEAEEGEPPRFPTDLIEEAPPLSEEEEVALTGIEDHLCSKLESVVFTERQKLSSTGQSCVPNDDGLVTAADLVGLENGTNWIAVINRANRFPDWVATHIAASARERPDDVRNLLSLRGGALSAHLEMACVETPPDWVALLTESMSKDYLATIVANQELARAERAMIEQATSGQDARNPNAQFPGAESSALVRLHHFIHEQYRMSESQPINMVTETNSNVTRPIKISKSTAKLSVNIGHLTATGDSWLLVGAWTASQPLQKLAEVLVRANLARDLVATGADPSSHGALATRNGLKTLADMQQPNAPKAPLVKSIQQMMETPSPQWRNTLAECPESVLAMMVTSLLYPSQDAWKLLRTCEAVPEKTMESLLNEDALALMAKAACVNSSSIELLSAQMGAMARLGFSTVRLEVAWKQTHGALALPEPVQEDFEKARAKASRTVRLQAKLKPEESA